MVPGCRYKMTNVDSEGTGEICFWGRNVFMGFLNMEDKTRDALDEDGWLHSGDLGKIDEEGFLYITGRKKGTAIWANKKIACLWSPEIYVHVERRSFILVRGHQQL